MSVVLSNKKLMNKLNTIKIIPHSYKKIKRENKKQKNQQNFKILPL